MQSLVAVPRMPRSDWSLSLVELNSRQLLSADRASSKSVNSFGVIFSSKSLSVVQCNAWQWTEYKIIYVSSVQCLLSSVYGFCVRELKKVNTMWSLMKRKWQLQCVIGASASVNCQTLSLQFQDGPIDRHKLLHARSLGRLAVTRCMQFHMCKYRSLRWSWVAWSGRHE